MLRKHSISAKVGSRKTRQRILTMAGMPSKTGHREATISETEQGCQQSSVSHANC